MNIILITQNTPFFIPDAIKNIVNGYSESIKSIIIIPDTKENMIEELAQRIQIFGFFVTIKLLFLFIYHKIGQFFASFIELSRNYSLYNIANKNGLKIKYITDINDSNSIDYIASFKPDLFVSISPPQKFGETLLSLPKKGSINLHGSLLPRHRGLQPSFWALKENDSVTGCTVHYMDSKLDSGKVLAQSKYKIKPHYKQFDIIKINKILGTRILLNIIEKIESNQCQEFEIDISKGNYNSFPNRIDYLQFSVLGRKIL